MSDNNQQLAAHISYRLKSGEEFISDFADSLSRMPEFLLTEGLLERKKESLELDKLILVSEDGTLFPAVEDYAYVKDWIEEHQEAWKESVVSYVKDKSILFLHLSEKKENRSGCCWEYKVIRIYSLW